MTVRVNKRKLEQLIQTTPGRANQLLRGAATEIVGDIVLSFGTSPDGREYQRGGVTHIASQPGYPPNVDTGTLRASMRWEQESPLRMVIHDGVLYGIFLEYGTEKMEARPFVTPVFEQWRQRKFREFARDFGVFI
jgi:HK97 gp10 family phage protein